MAPESTVRPSAEFRPDVQGLRAVAVMLVVLYHLFPGRVSGGYVGVDVFFVISGYLITRHLATEVERDGRVRLARFWARRARRLLPASLLVLLASLALAAAFLPQTVWPDTVRQVIGSALYVQNWVLADDAVDYSAIGAAATVVQHYWSLSVEEQFYVLWPVLLSVLVAVANLAGRRPGVRRLPVRVTMAAGLGVVLVVSLFLSVTQTEADQARAYFVTHTRLWEFALGGLLGLVWHRGLVRSRPAAVLAWSGLAAIVVAAVTFDAGTAFPGWIALVPVLGTAAVLAGGAGSAEWGPQWLTWRPTTFVGDLSYAIYLWHWPLAVVLPWALDRTMGPGLAGLVLLLTFVLAWGSTRFVEDPLRRGRLLRPVPAALAAGGLGMAIVVLAALGLRAQLPASVTVAVPRDTHSCVGPGALDPANGCGPVAGDGPPQPGPGQVALQNREERPYADCQADSAAPSLLSCDLGVPAAEAHRTVAVVGDSHATAWLTAVDEIGRRNGWQVKTWTMSSCPLSLSVRHVEGETDRSLATKCQGWVDEVDRTLLADDSISIVVTASYSTAYTFTDRPGTHTADPAVDGFETLWARWRAAGKQVVVFDDVPRTLGEDVPTCLAAADSPQDCATPRHRALPTVRPISQAIRAVQDQPGMHRVDLSEQFCDDAWCYVQVGRLIVYRDYSHLSREYALALVPFIEAQLAQRWLTR